MITVNRGKEAEVSTRRITRTIKFGALLLVASVITLMGFHQASAADEIKNSANTLKISPVRSDISIKAGESSTVKINLTNLDNAPIQVQPIENDFVARDESGTPALILNADQYAPTHSLKRFMAPLSEVTIPSKASATVNLVINVPKTAQPGGYFGAVRFAPATPGSGGQVNLNASAASIILLTVPGPTVEKLDLKSFDIKQNGGKPAATFSSPDKLQISALFQNDGNLQEGPFGYIAVKQGTKVVYSTEFNNKNPRDMVLPDSSRRWDIPLKNIGKFGHFTVSATFTYGTKNQTIDVTKSFWVIPRLYVIAAIVAVVVLIGLIVGAFLLFRHHRRRMVRNRVPRGGLGRR